MFYFLAFRPVYVQILTVVIFAALFTSLLYTNRVVPPAPRSATPAKGINLTQAWLDLQHLTFNPHPYNSHFNDDVRNWLLSRAEAILVHNDVDFAVENNIDASADDLAAAPVVVFNDITSNITFSNTASNQTVYFEGTNIIYYIRGSEDPTGPFWRNATPRSYEQSTSPDIKGGVLVNAHYDSVSTGYGATDDGMGVITVLQLLSYFTLPEHRPKKGIVLLLNNGEEDYLNGAWAFLRNPISTFPHVFLNLEGAGAGGRATLFRSTDTEVTRHYKRSKYPFGTSISADGFKRRLIQSQTDYVVFNGQLGLRGLDVAFMEPRSRYHTSHDSTKYTTVDSLWHMLSASLTTVKSLSSDTSSTFDGHINQEGKVDAGHGTEPVYFDLFGRVFVVFEQHTMFAWTVTELVAAPIILILLEVLLSRLGKWYLFSRYQQRPQMINYEGGEITGIDEGEKVPLYGWRGFFRYPIVFVIATAADIALAFLLTKFNPLVVYSSEWAVWSMMLTAWITVSWFLLRGADAIRPTALNRAYALLWMFSGAWVVLVGVTVLENNLHIGGGYFMMFYYAAIFLALLLSYIELLFAPSKEKYVEYLTAAALAAGEDEDDASTRPTTAGTSAQRPNSQPNGPEDSEDAQESTSLLRNDRGTSFGRGYGTHRHSTDGGVGSEHVNYEELLPQHPYENEQGWSAWLPTSIWAIQFLLLSIVPIVLVGQIALLLTAALHQTLADGSSVLNVYISVAILGVLVLAPSLPFIHRYAWPIPTFLFFIFGGTLIYNLIAFPFSPNNQLKVFFIQRVDLDSGLNTVSLTGLSPFVENIYSGVPSASGIPGKCVTGKNAERAGLATCSWNGLAPTVGAAKNWPKISPIPPEKDYPSWIRFNSTNISNSTRISTKYAATIKIYGRNTRNCRIYFDGPVLSINVTDAPPDKRIPAVGDNGTRELRLWSRSWDRVWELEVGWEAQKGLDGRVACEWNDDARPASVPALEELRRALPNWATVSKTGDGLVEGYKRFMI